MSWDVLLTRLPYSIKSVHELPDDYEAPPLGPRHEVEKALRTAAPSIKISENGWAELAGSAWSIQLDLGEEDPVPSILLNVYEPSDDVLQPIFRMASELRCRVLDCSAGDLIIEHELGTRRTLPWRM